MPVPRTLVPLVINFCRYSSKLYLPNHNDRMEKGKDIPMIKGDFLLGSLRYYKKDPIAFFKKNTEEQGDIWRFHVAGRQFIFVNHPDYIKPVLQENHRNYIKSAGYRKLKALLGDGLFTSEGDYWLKQRRLAAPAFHKKRIDAYAEIMANYTETMLNRWDGAFQEGQTIDIHKEMVEVTLKIVTDTLMAIRVEEEVQAIEKYFPFALNFMERRVIAGISPPLKWPLPSHNKFRDAVGRMDAIVNRLIDERRASGEDRGDLLSMFMQVKDEDTGEGMSDQQLRDEMLTFFLAGHETSAVTASWTLYLLDKYPEAEQKLRHEIDTVLQGRRPTLDDFKNMPYLRYVINESMRIISPIWAIAREAVAEDVIGGYQVNKGDSVIISSYLTHLKEDIFENANTFNPDRWADGFEKKLPKFAYFPFGGGPRLCIGYQFAILEMQVILSMVLQKYRFSLVEEPEYEFSLTLRPKHGVHMKVFKYQEQAAEVPAS